MKRDMTDREFGQALDREMDRRLDEHLRDSKKDKDEDSVIVDWNFIYEPIPYYPTGKETP